VPSAILAVVEDFTFDGLVSVVAIFPFGAAEIRLLEQQLQFVRLDLFFFLEQFILRFDWLVLLWPASFIVQSVILSSNQKEMRSFAILIVQQLLQPPVAGDLVCSRPGSWVGAAELAAESMARPFHLEVWVGFGSASRGSPFVEVAEAGAEVVGGPERVKRTHLEIPSEFRLMLAAPHSLLQV
jgi:hypothetical protein